MRRRIVRFGIVLGVLLAIAPALPASAGGGCHAAGTTSARTTDVVMSQNCFTPTLARVPVGATVTWFNKDGAAHTVTAANVAFGDLRELELNETFRARFDKAGVYPYYCTLHPAMAGAIIVGDGTELLSAVNRTDGIIEEGSENVALPVSPATEKVAATTPAPANSAWPAVATAIGLGSAGVGFWVSRVLGGARSRES